MTSLNVSMPDEMRAFIESRLAQEGYATPSEYLCALVYEAQKRNAKKALESKFREALENGPSTPMTREDWDSIEAEALARLAREQAKQ
jgi:antitoxin ParD1/3/4